MERSNPLPGPCLRWRGRVLGASRAIGRKWIGPLLFVLAGAMHLRLVAAVEVDEDWPRFLGPHANNISSETGLLDKWPTNGLPLVWEKRIGSGYSAPSGLQQRLDRKGGR